LECESHFQITLSCVFSSSDLSPTSPFIDRSVPAGVVLALRHDDQPCRIETGPLFLFHHRLLNKIFPAQMPDHRRENGIEVNIPQRKV
jgi:hypothetical protein